MRHYSKGRLVAIGCDACRALIAPNPNIAESGWMKCGWEDDSGRHERDYCPTHVHRIDQHIRAGEGER